MPTLEEEQDERRGLPTVSEMLERTEEAERFRNTACEITGMTPDEVLGLLERIDEMGALDVSDDVLRERLAMVGRTRSASDEMLRERQAGAREFRVELGTYVMTLLGTTEFQERPPHWLLDLAERLADL